MKLNHRQLTFAREYRGYSQTALSKKILGLSQPNLSRFEKGFTDSLSDEILDEILLVLKFPKSFLKQNISNKSETAHFRKRATITKGDRSYLEKSYRLVGYLIDRLSESVMWPDFSLKAVDLEEGFTPQAVARNIRKQLRLKADEPVKDICNLLELNGIIIVELDAIQKFDGVSFVSDDGMPIMVINKNFSNDRKRFTIAHELGHLIMHSIDNPLIPIHRENELENEANTFASEFLMPAEGIKSSLYNLQLRDLAKLKSYWLTSMASIIRRAKDLKCIDQNRYTYLNVEMSRRGLKRDEGLDVFIDSPNLFRKAFFLHKNELEYTNNELAEAFDLPIDIIEEFMDSTRGGRLKIVL